MTQQVEAIVLREADEEECRLGGMEPLEALNRSVALSTRAFMVQVEGRTLAYWGYRSTLLAGHCNAWMLSTPEIERHPLFAARKSREFLDQLLTTHFRVDCIVSPDYALSLRWLKWLGFAPINSFGPYTVMSIERGGSA